MAVVKDPSPSPESACTEEPNPASGIRSPAETLIASSPARPATSPRLRRLLLCLELCLKLFLHLGLQYLIAWLEYKTNIFNNQGTMNETKITFSATI